MAVCLLELAELRRVAEVDDPVELLEEGQVDGEEPFDDVGGHGADGPELSDDPGEHHHREIGVVLLHPEVAQRLDLVPGRGQTHHAVTMQASVTIDVALRQGELELRLEVRHAGASCSYSSDSSMSTASFDPADSAPMLSLDGQPLTKFQRPCSSI